MRVEINLENNFVIHENESPQSIGTQLETIEKIFNKQLDSANKMDRAKDFARLKDWAQEAYNKDQSSRKLRRITDFLASTIIGQLLGIQTESMKLRERISSIMQKNGTIYKEIGRYGCQEQDPQKRMNYFTSLKKEWENLSDTGKVPAKYNGLFEKFLVEVDSDKKDNEELLKFSAALGKNSRIKRIIESRVSIPKEYPIQGAKEWKELKEAHFAPASNVSYQQFIQDILKGTDDPAELLKIFKQLNKEDKPFLCLCVLVRLNELPSSKKIAYDKEIVTFLAKHKAPAVTEKVLERFFAIPLSQEIQYLIAGAIEGKNNSVFIRLASYATDEQYIKACEKGLDAVRAPIFVRNRQEHFLYKGLASAMANNSSVVDILALSLKNEGKDFIVRGAIADNLSKPNFKIGNFKTDILEILSHITESDEKQLLSTANDDVIILLLSQKANPIEHLKKLLSVPDNNDLVRALIPNRIKLLDQLIKLDDPNLEQAIKKVLTTDRYEDNIYRLLLKNPRLADIVQSLPGDSRIRQLQLSLK